MTPPADDPNRSALDVAFAPRSLAVVGGLSDTRGFGGAIFLRSTQELGIIPHTYGVSPKGGTLPDGSPIYTSLREIPGDVEYVISAVPSGAVLDLIDDAAAKGTRIIHFFTAGFGETGDPERTALEQEMVRRANAAGIRLLGPNCMGIYSPIGGVNWMLDAPKDVGRTGVVSQSGMNAGAIVEGGAIRAIRFSRVVSYGNAADFIESDYLEYLADDPETDLVLCYIEGVRDGPRFVRVMRRLAAEKPVAILKGGSTEAGSRAASSHTGSLAGSSEIWEAVRRQTGFMPAHNVEELLDLGLTVEHLRDVAGPRVAIIGGGGGASVVYADAVDRYGLEMPWFSEETQERLGEFIPVAGTSVRNPLDSGLMRRGELLKALQIISQDPNIDFLLYHFSVEMGAIRRQGNASMRPFADRLMEALEELKGADIKPLAMVMRQPQTVDGMDLALELQDRIGKMGFAVFPTIDRFALAARRFLDWKGHRGEL